MPMLRLTGKPAGTSKSPARKSAPKRKPSAKQAPTRKPAAKAKAPARKAPAQETQAQTNGGTRGPKLPEGWTKRDFERAVKDMQKAKAAREAAAEKLAEAQATANGLALEMLKEGIQMSVVSTELELSRQWLYTLMEKNGMTPARSRSTKRSAPKRSAASGRTSKPAAKKRPAKQAPKAAPSAKRAPARKRPASKPASKGRVRLAR